MAAEGPRVSRTGACTFRWYRIVLIEVQPFISLVCVEIDGGDLPPGLLEAPVDTM